MAVSEPLYGKNPAELAALCAETGLPRFAAGQLARWLYVKHIENPMLMTDIPAARRALLAERFRQVLTPPERVTESADGTKKYLFRTQQGAYIESAYIPDGDRATLCVSSQAGCRMGCKFCATGRQGLQRSLTAAEILNQIVSLPERDKLTNIVFMGMGEPLLNYDNVIQAIERITGEDSLGMSPSRLTLSTSGITEGIRRLADDGVRFNLAISLHSAINATRDKLMPINKAYPLPELAEAIRYFVDKTGTRPTFEYLLLKGVNDSLDDAKALAQFCRQFPVKINIIEYNEVDNAPYRHSPDANRDQFVRFLESKNIVVNVRRSKGKDIDAACGQLANKNK